MAKCNIQVFFFDFFDTRTQLAVSRKGENVTSQLHVHSFTYHYHGGDGMFCVIT